MNAARTLAPIIALAVGLIGAAPAVADTGAVTRTRLATGLTVLVREHRGAAPRSRCS